MRIGLSRRGRACPLRSPQSCFRPSQYPSRFCRRQRKANDGSNASLPPLIFDKIVADETIRRQQHRERLSGTYSDRRIANRKCNRFQAKAFVRMLVSNDPSNPSRFATPNPGRHLLRSNPPAQIGATKRWMPEHMIKFFEVGSGIAESSHFHQYPALPQTLMRCWKALAMKSARNGTNIAVNSEIRTRGRKKKSERSHRFEISSFSLAQSFSGKNDSPHKLVLFGLFQQFS